MAPPRLLMTARPLGHGQSSVLGIPPLPFLPPGCPGQGKDRSKVVETRLGNGMAPVACRAVRLRIRVILGAEQPEGAPPPLFTGQWLLTQIFSQGNCLPQT